MSEMVPMYGFGGGIDNLKFRVYAATSLPASGRENDVCIITSTPISWWEVFPVTPTWISENGHVYIQNDPAYNGDYPNVNIIKKNGCIWLYLVRCWQYENGTWSSKDAYQYRNGAWVQFSTTFKATIHITYPAGSTCTATDGATTITAPNTSGAWDCVVNKAGTWTIRTSQYDAVNVNVSNGDNTNVTLSLVLFNSGNDLSNLTGGWSNSDWSPACGGVVNDGSKLIFNNTEGSTYKGGGSNNKINVSGYKTLVVSASIEGFHSGSGSDARFGIYTSKNLFDPSAAYYPAPSADASFSLDVSKNSGSYYIGFLRIGTVRKVVLEP